MRYDEYRWWGAQLIHSDKNMIKQIMSKLISNASKFTETGEVAITASLLNGEPLVFAFSLRTQALLTLIHLMSYLKSLSRMNQAAS